MNSRKFRVGILMGLLAGIGDAWAAKLHGAEVKVTASDGTTNDYFGVSVALAGDVAVVGAHQDDDAGTGSGSAYVFERNAGGTNAWEQVKKLTASDPAAGDLFGLAVSADGDVVVVGAQYADAPATNSGSAYVFERNAGGTNAWGEVRKLTASDGATWAVFGCAVAVAGDVAVVGAFEAAGGRGAAYVFERNAGGTNAWGQVRKLVAADADAGDSFGSAVGVDGDVVVVGAVLDDALGPDAGAAYVFERNAGGTNAWGQVRKITASDGALYGGFGLSAAVAGDLVVVGSFGYTPGGDYLGGAYVFERNAGGTNAWGQVRRLATSDGLTNDDFGASVTVRGDVVVVGAPSADSPAADSGAVYVFERHAGGTNAWSQTRKLTASDTAAADRFGSSVAVAGDVAITGAPGEDSPFSSSGSAYVLPITAQTKAFLQTAKLTALDGTTNDEFGVSTAVAGNLAVVGAQGDDDTAGSVVVFERHMGGTNAWRQVKKLVALDREARDRFGESVAVAGDVVVVGAPLDNDDAGDPGSAYVFERHAGGTNAWGQVKKLVTLDSGAGNAVAVDGNVVVVGASSDDAGGGEDTGSAYVFERHAGGMNAWGRVRKLTASDGSTNDFFGNAVAVAGDLVVVGAVHDDSPVTNAGSAYVFERNAGGINAWGQVLKLVAADAAEQDGFGRSVGVDGDVVVVGAPENDTAGANAGSAYVFERNAGGINAWGQVHKLTPSDGMTNGYFGYAVAVAGDAVVVTSVAGFNSGTVYVFQRNAGGTNAWGQVRKLTALDAAGGDLFGASVAAAGDVVVVGAFGNDDAGDHSGSAYIFEELFPGPEAPVIQGVEEAGGLVRFAWTSAVPVDYTVQYKNRLNDGAEWSNLPGAVNLPGTDSLLWISNPVPATSRVYRVKAVDSPLR